MAPIKALFVGDAPSSKNLDKKIAFIGTPSHLNLQKWLKFLGFYGTDNYLMINSHNQEELRKIKAHSQEGYKLVSLGNIASNRLDKINLEHFKLPHPSPRNRKLNNPVFLEVELIKCKIYLKNL